MEQNTALPMNTNPSGLCNGTLPRGHGVMDRAPAWDASNFFFTRVLVGRQVMEPVTKKLHDLAS